MQVLVTRTQTDDYLAHYGVKGQKWGIRRYQNADGTRTREGRRRAREEYKEDNKTAKELGKVATIYGHAAAKSMNRTIKIENKLDKQYEKDPHGLKKKTQSLKKQWDASAKTTLQLTEQYAKTRDAAEKHCQSLIDKYGKEAVSSIKYTDKKIRKGTYSPETLRVVNEGKMSAGEVAAYVGGNLLSGAMSAVLNTPVTLLYIPETTGDRARRLERDMYRSNR